MEVDIYIKGDCSRKGSGQLNKISLSNSFTIKKDTNPFYISLITKYIDSVTLSQDDFK